ncbi:MAG: phosphoribosylglycinamide formyltransferase [Fervidobacterium sp.]
MHGLFQSELSCVTPRIVVCASGNGSNFESIAKSIIDKRLDAIIETLIADRECYAIQRAKDLGIPYILLDKPWYKHFENVVDKLNPDLIVLAGFMRIIPENIVEKYYQKIVNIHPSLLPSFPGKDAIKQAYEYGVKVTGITIHFVDNGVDTGPIIFQKALEIQDNWTLEEIENRIHHLEHEYYWQVIRDILSKNIKIEGRKVTWGEV